VKQQVTDFINHLKNSGRYAEKTVKAYTEDMDKWFAVCQKNQITNWANIEKEDVKHWIIQFKQKDITVKSIRRYLSAFKLFFEYLNETNQAQNNPAFGIKTPKIETRLPKTLDYNQIEVLIAFIKKSNYAKRDVAIFELLYGSALRVSEIVALDINDIDFKSSFIKVLGKGNKERYTPLGNYAQNALKQYLESREDDNKALFLNQRQGRLGVRGLQKILEILGLTSPLGIHLHPHMLRHSAATHFLQSSHDLSTTQTFLGHESVKSTQVYTHLDFLDLANTYDKAHPLAKKNDK
jgi:integrase/recombinase XerC